MPNFCRQCGSPVTPNSAFCGQCGTQQSGGSPPVAAPSNAAPPQPGSAPAQTVFPPAPRRGGSLGKFVLIVLACIGLLLTATGVGIYYAVHKVKQIAVAKVHEYGLDTASHSGAHAAMHHVDVCQLLSTKEATKLLREPVTRAEPQLDACLYFGPPGLSAKLSHNQMAGLIKESKTAANQVDAAGFADAATNLAGSMASEEGLGVAPAGDTPLLTLTVIQDGKAQMIALRASKFIFSGVKGAGADIPDLGDQAVQLANLGLNVLQGETLVRIVTGPVPNAHERSVAVARQLLPRLSATLE